ncbi:sulfite exporter TauE/SafE family protein [Sphingopyxis sp.]|uniref:sulfite exporter TauE/SafE family protein n=1 Tax=Sphingopyxis sp. TaxID=1908224 RepID=UPI0025E81E42|nr:sulfite exporter TauE/SafE family protein [Sphingopyxis sp.]MBR2172513.1 sulfite exporter TauE/SafE family protein [Sphingopyxis sp.]
MIDLSTIFIAAGAGMFGGAMNALAGGGTFATLPALIALGLPANIASATSNVALLPGAGTSAWAYRNELGPVAGISVRLLAALTFLFGLVGSLLLVLTPTETFDIIIPWLLLFAFAVMVFGTRAADWLHARVTIGRPTLLVAQALLGVYGGYFGGGVGLITTALYGLLANIRPRELFAIRTAMLAVANLAAAFIFIGFTMVWWWACVPMLLGSIVGGWLGAIIGKRLSHRAVRVWTLLVTGITTIIFFVRAYGA